MVASPGANQDEGLIYIDEQLTPHLRDTGVQSLVLGETTAAGVMVGLASSSSLTKASLRFNLAFGDMSSTNSAHHIFGFLSAFEYSSVSQANGTICPGNLKEFHP